jgi:hypothetical protein
MATPVGETGSKVRFARHPSTIRKLALHGLEEHAVLREGDLPPTERESRHAQNTAKLPIIPFLEVQECA